MAKKRKRKPQVKSAKKQGTFGYCSACGSHKRIEGVCHICGYIHDADSK